MTTCLLNAVETGNLRKIRHLLRKDGKLVNSKDLARMTPLHLAAKLGDADIVKILIEAGAKVDKPFSSKTFGRPAEGFSAPANALQFAAANGHASVSDVLLAAGSKVLDKEGEFQALDRAARHGHLEALKVILARRRGRLVTTSHKSRALCFALVYGHVECARFFISNGADVNEPLVLYNKRHKPNPPLYFSLENQCDPFDTTALKTDNVVLELIQMLVEAGASIRDTCWIRFQYGSSSRVIEANFLSCAACYGRSGAVSYLLAKGADITAKAGYEWGALHFAVASGSPKTVDILLQAGAADQVTWEPQNCFNTSHDDEDSSTIEITNIFDIIGVTDVRLYHSGRRNESSLCTDYKNIIHLLENYGAELEAENEFGNTPLHSACLIADRTTPAGCHIFDICPISGSDITKMRARFCMQTVRRMHPFISALLQAGADPGALNSSRQTPLHLLLSDLMTAIEGVSNGYHYTGSCSWSWEQGKPYIQEFLTSVCDSVRVLVEAGANLNQRNAKARDPLHELMHGMREYHKYKNIAYLRYLSDPDIQSWNYGAIYDGSCSQLTTEDPFSYQHELDSIIVQFIKCGAGSWEVVPEPCLGLQSALYDVWKGGSDDELLYLCGRLEKDIKPRLQTSLLVLNRYLPGEKDVQMQILAAGL